MIARNIHSQFRFSSLDDLRSAMTELNLELPVSEDIEILKRPVPFLDYEIPNAMAIQPMEGCDGTADGSPDELTYRRYERFAAGGAGILWFEACAVVPEGRANPRQLWLHENNKQSFKRMLERSLDSARQAMRERHKPFTVLQLTHSGRYSRPIDAPAPVIAHHDPILDASRNLQQDYPLITDDDLEMLEDRFVDSARLAYEVGFDAVDIKSCHRYLINEILAAHTRDGRYGGGYDNRTRFLKNVFAKIKSSLGESLIVTCRLNIFDGHPFPYGFGVSQDDANSPNLEEPLRLVRDLREMGMRMINITMGNPYFTPHINRPYDRPTKGVNPPDEHPLVGVARFPALTGEIQSAAPDVLVVGGGLSWLRHLWPFVAAGSLREGKMKMIGLGRQAFAHPSFAKDIIEKGSLDKKNSCITCALCSQIMRDGGRTGCATFDRDIYWPIYREGRLKDGK